MAAKRYFASMAGFAGQLITPVYCIEGGIKWSPDNEPYYEGTMFDGTTLSSCAVGFDQIYKRCAAIDEEDANYITDGAFA